MDTSLLYFIISLGIALGFVKLGYEDMCLFCRILAYMSSLSTVYFFIEIFDTVAPLWLLAIPIVIGTIYLIPEYIEDYKSGKTHREKIEQKRRENTTHYFLVRDQEQD